LASFPQESLRQGKEGADPCSGTIPSKRIQVMKISLPDILQSVSEQILIAKEARLIKPNIRQYLADVLLCMFERTRTNAGFSSFPVRKLLS
jgi:hypothetical protein